MSENMSELPAPTATSRGVALFKKLRRIMTGEFAISGYISAVDQGIISLVNFLAAVVLARNTSLTEFGVYGVGFTILRLGRALQEGLIIQPLNTYGAGEEHGLFRRYASTSMILQLVLALVTSAGVWLVGYLLTVTGNDTAGPMILGLWFSFFITQIQEFLRRMFYTRNQTGLALLNTIVTNGVRMVVLFRLIDKGDVSGLTGLDAIAWGALAGVIFGLWNGRSYWTRNLLNIRETAIRDLKFGRWVLGGVVANYVAVEFYPVMTAGMISFAAAGAYRAIQNLMAPILTLLRATDTFFVPRMSKMYNAEGIHALKRPLKYVYFFIGMPTIAWLLFISIFDTKILTFVYGEEYAVYALGVPIMSLFYFLWYVYWPVQIAIKAARISKPLFYANVTAIVLMFTVGLLMIYKWGVYGTMAGQALNAFVVAVILWAAWIREVKIRDAKGEANAATVP